MTAATQDYGDMHRLVDRLSPAQVQRLRVLAAADPELRAALDDKRAAPCEPADSDRRWLALAGWDPGRSDVAERHDEFIRQRFTHSA